MRRPLVTHLPALAARVPLVELGELPTRVERAPALERATAARTELWLKRDDLSSPVYGGNKVRTLEVLFGAALERGSRRIWSTGAFGTNHGLATVLHAPRAGLEPGVLLFPQPHSETAEENLRAMIGAGPRLRALPHWSALPLGMWQTARADPRATVMVPGGATPEGALGYVSAALELGEQVARGELPAPGTVVVGVGSTCTSAGLLVGLCLAARRGVGFTPERRPRLLSVRVTPWPVTSRARILGLARETAQHLARLAGDPALAFELDELGRGFEVTGRYLGNGYGRPTARGRAATAHFTAHAGFALDTTYSAKVAAAFLHQGRRGEGGPLLFWSTKSTAPLPTPRAGALAEAPAAFRRWLAAAP